MSYSSADRAWVSRLVHALRNEGLEPWVDYEQIPAGDRFQEAIAAGLDQSSAVAVLVGGGDHTRWMREEALVAVDRAVTDSGDQRFRVFLVLLPGAPDPFEPDVLSPFLAQRSWVDLRRTNEAQLGARLIARAALGQAPAGEPTVSDSNICPYVGLRSFGRDDSHWFFGRDADIQRIVELLGSGNVVTIMGRSGAGKSSILHSGVLLSIADGNIIDRSDTWQVAALRPGRTPLDRLARAVSDLRPDVRTGTLVEDLRDDPATLTRLTHSDDNPVLWVVDQAEELFTLCDSAAEREAFSANLVHAVHYGSARLVLALRSDFYHRFAELRDLGQRMAAHQYLVTAMSRDQLAHAIVQPARLVGLELVDGLAERIIADLGDEPGALPLLQYALSQLWELRRGNYLTHEAYAAIGGVGTALSNHAESALKGLSESETRAARRLLVSLVALGESGQETRQPARLADIASDRVPLARLRDVASRLADLRLITTRGELGNGDKTEVELSHDGLIGSWPTLQRWLNEGRETELARRQVRDDALRWDSDERDPDWLYRGLELQSARHRFGDDPDDLPRLEAEFIVEAVTAAEGAARHAEERETRRRRNQRRLLAAAAAAAVVLAIAAATALVFQRQAEQQADQARSFQAEAEQQAEEARAQTRTALTLSLEVEAVRLAQDNPALALALAIEAWGPETPGWKISPGYTMAATNYLTKFLYARPPLSGHSGPVDSVAFSPDGTLLATGSQDQTVRIWDLASADEPELMADFAVEAAVDVLEFSPDGGILALLASSGLGEEACRQGDVSGKCVIFWDVASSSQIGNAAIVDASVDAVEFSPDGQSVLTFGRFSRVLLWDATTGTQVGLPLGPELLEHATFNSDGTRVLVIDSRKVLTEWDVATRRTTRHSLPVDGRAFAFSADRRTVAVETVDDASCEAGDCVWHLELRDAETGERLGRPLRHEAVDTTSPTSLEFSGDGATLYATNPGWGVAVWDLRHRHPVLTMVPGNVNRLWTALPTTSDDGSLLAVAQGHGGEDGVQFQVWDGAEATPLGGPIDLPAVPAAFAFSPDNAIIAVGTNQGTVTLWDFASHENLLRLSRIPGFKRPGFGETGPIGTIPGSDGDRAVIASQDAPEDGLHGLSLWAIDGGVRVAGPFIGHTDEINDVALSSDGVHLATASNDDSVRVWNVQTGEQVGAPLVSPDDSPVYVSLSADGRRLLTRTKGQRFLLWDFADGSHVDLTPDQTVWWGTFSPDGRTVAARVGGGSDAPETVRFWDAVTGEAIAGTPEASVASGDTTFLWGGGGGRLLIGGFSGSFSLWDTNARRRIGDVTAGHTNAIRAFDISSDGSVLATGGTDQVVRLWDAVTLGPIGESMRGHTRPVRALALSPDGELLVSVTRGHLARLWETSTQQPIGGPILGDGDATRSVTFLHDGESFVTVSEAGEVQSWDSLLWDPTAACAALRTAVALDDIRVYLPDGFEPQGCLELNGPKANGNGVSSTDLARAATSNRPSVDEQPVPFVAAPTPTELPPRPTPESRGTLNEPVPLPVASLEVEGFGFRSSLDLTGLVEIAQPQTEEGSGGGCMVLIGSVTLLELESGVAHRAVPELGTVSSGDYARSGPLDCKAPELESLGYAPLGRSSITPGTTYPFYVPLWVRGDRAVDAVAVHNRYTSAQLTYLSPVTLDAVPPAEPGSFEPLANRTDPLQGVSFTGEDEEVQWRVELTGLVRAERLEAGDPGSCVVLTGTLQPDRLSGSGVVGGEEVPSFGAIVDGHYERSAWAWDCAVGEFESAGYRSADDFSGTEGTNHPFYVPFILEDGAMLQAIVRDEFPYGSGDGALFAPELTVEIPRPARAVAGELTMFSEPLEGAVVSLTRFETPWSLDLVGLTKAELAEPDPNGGTCLVLLATAFPEIAIAEPSWSLPTIGLIASGRYYSAKADVGDQDCDASAIEAAGYQPLSSLGGEEDEPFAFYVEMVVPPGSEPETLAVGAAVNSLSAVYFTVDPIETIPDAAEHLRSG